MAIGIDLAIGSSAASGGGGSVNTGVLQISGGGALSGTLQTITDQSSNASPLQLSTTQVAIPTGIFTVDAQMRFNGTIYNTIDDIVKFGGAIRTATFASIGGTFTNSARLHVRGDGTNPIARFEGTGGVTGFRVTSDGLGILPINGGSEYISAGYDGGLRLDGSVFSLARAVGVNVYGVQYYAASGNSYYSGHFFTLSHAMDNISNTSRVLSVHNAQFAAGAGSGSFQPFAVTYTINNSGAQTGTATGIFLNATETALNGMTHNLMDLQTGGVSQFKVEREGSTTMASFSAGSGQITGAGSLLVGAKARLYGGSVAGNSLLITDANVTGAAFIQLGGTTNAFPAIKRNGAAIDFRLADDSGFCDISSSKVNSPVFNSSTTIDFYAASYFTLRPSGGGTEAFVSAGYTSFGGVGSNSGSCVFELLSTTKGFLPPRMTTTEVNAISTPAEGLVVFNTTISHLCVYQSGGWVRMSHSPM
jgi:hypothetical protein